MILHTPWSLRVEGARVIDSLALPGTAIWLAGLSAGGELESEADGWRPGVVEARCCWLVLG